MPVRSIGHLFIIMMHLVKVFSTMGLYFLKSLKANCSNVACFLSMRPIFGKWLFLIIGLLIVLKTLFCFIEFKITSKTYIKNILLNFKTVIYYFCLDHHHQHNLLCSKFSHILARSVLFTVLIWICKTLY